MAFINLYHKDNTSLPPAEGGASCNNGCTEQVTRLQSGSSISGNFTYLQTFSVQVAYSGDTNVGTAIIKACGQTIRTEDLYIANQGTPGFVNVPQPGLERTHARRLRLVDLRFGRLCGCARGHDRLPHNARADR